MTPSRTPPAPPQPPASPDGDADFETLFRRLEAVTQSLDDGSLTLEQSVALYEEGVMLARACEQLLLNAAQRIEVLDGADADGASTLDLDMSEDEA